MYLFSMYPLYNTQIFTQKMIFRDQLELLNAMKFYISIKVYMRKNIHDTTDTGNFRTSATTILKTSNLEEVVQQHYNALQKKMDEFVRNGNAIYLNIHLNNSSPPYQPQFQLSFFVRRFYFVDAMYTSSGVF